MEYDTKLILEGLQTLDLQKINVGIFHLRISPIILDDIWFFSHEYEFIIWNI